MAKLNMKIDCTELNKALDRLENLLKEHPKTMQVLVKAGDGESFLKLLSDSINAN